MKMNLRWIVLGLALVCFAQVLAKPADKTTEDSDYQEDDGQDDKTTDYDDEDKVTGPVTALSVNETIFALPGANVTLPCEVQNSDSVAIEWRTGSNSDLFLDTVKMTSDPRISRDARNKSLIIVNVNMNDTGEYKCTATAQPPVVLLHKLFVVPKDRQVTVLPKDQNDILQGESIVLTCQVGAELNPQSMHWSREGHLLHSEESKVNGQIRAISLAVNNATRHVAGDYQCIVDTGAEEPIVKHLQLKVKHKPEIEYEKERDGEHVHHLSHYTTAIGADLNITCVVHAHPGMTSLEWIVNGNNVYIDNMHYFRDDHVRSHHVLGIKNVTRADLGEWQCRAYNARGESVGPKITVSDAPGKPRFVEGGPVDDKIEMRWKVVSYNRVTDAEFLYRKEGDGDDKWQRGEIKSIDGIGKENVIVTILSGIEPGKYEAKVRARNDKGHSEPHWGPFSNEHKFDGEYKDAEASTGKGSSAIPNLMSLLFIIVPLAYACN